MLYSRLNIDARPDSSYLGGHQPFALAFLISVAVL